MGTANRIILNISVAPRCLYSLLMRNTIKNCAIIRQISDKKYLIVIVGERGEQFVIDLRDSLQRRYELVRELKLSDRPKEEICAKYWYSKKKRGGKLEPHTSGEKRFD